MTCFKYFIAFHPFIKNYKYTTKSDHERFSKVLFDYFELVKKWESKFFSEILYFVPKSSNQVPDGLADSGDVIGVGLTIEI